MITRSIAIPVFLIGLYVVLQVSGLTRIALTVVGGTGVIGIVLGFAFRDIAENFLASLLLSIRNPFSAGDLIRVADHEGVVQNLNTRSTVLRTLEGNHVQIPNATVFKCVIVNYSADPVRRTGFVIGFGYEASTQQAQSLILDVLQDNEFVAEIPPPHVLVDSLGDATVNLAVDFWFDGAIHSPRKITSALLRQVKRALMDAGIEMPDTAREIVFPRGVPIIRSSAETGAARLGRGVTERASKDRDGSAAKPEPEQAIAEGEGDMSSDDAGLTGRGERQRTPEETENLLN